ncbi:MAG: type VI secretion system contractile sheath small subunit [Rhodospirillaceae bacterium]
MAESTQHKLSRIRPPRVQITYDVETGNALEKKELPFIAGILADLSGKPAEALPLLKDRKFVEVDRDNFQDVLGAVAPRLAFRVADKLKPDSTDMLNVELRFRSMDDFNPVEVLKQIPQLRRLYEARCRLRDLLTKLDGNDELDQLLGKVIQSTEDQAALKSQLAATAPAPEASPAE